MVINAYELMFMVNPELGEEETQALIERIRGYIEAADGQIFDLDHWGIRRLAYIIENHREGRYYLTHFTMPSENVNEVKRRMLLTENVLRELITRFDGELVGATPEPEAEPEAMPVSSVMSDPLLSDLGFEPVGILDEATSG